MNEIETIKDVLFKYSLPAISGMSSHEIAALIIQALRDRESNGIGEEVSDVPTKELQETKLCPFCGKAREDCTGDKAIVW